MTPEEYVAGALKTEAPTLDAAVRTSDCIRLLHAGMGFCTEAGEFQDALKRFIFYGKTVDETNLVEELGDLMWYIAIACDALGVSLEEVMEKNNRKLRTRFPDKFNEGDALNRNLDQERKELES